MVIAKVNGVLWDLERCLEDNCDLDLLKFDDNEGNDWNGFAILIAINDVIE